MVPHRPPHMVARDVARRGVAGGDGDRERKRPLVVAALPQLAQQPRVFGRPRAGELAELREPAATLPEGERFDLGQERIGVHARHPAETTNRNHPNNQTYDRRSSLIPPPPTAPVGVCVGFSTLGIRGPGPPVR